MGLTKENVAQGLVLTGMALDGLNKLSRIGLLSNYVLGYGSFLETHIGNFGNSTILAALIYRHLTEGMHVDHVPASVMTVVSVALINMIVETGLGLVTGFSEWGGDVAVGCIAGLALVMAVNNSGAENNRGVI